MDSGNDFFTSTYDESVSHGMYSPPPTSPSPMGRRVNIWTGRYEDEPPLLEELGISFTNIYEKTILALNPLQKEADPRFVQDSDLTGPLAFCMLFGVFLLLAGKIHFGYIYGMGVMSCLFMYALLNLMSMTGIDLARTASILGYCLLPIVLVAGLGILLPLKGLLGYILAGGSVLWCAKSAALMFVSALALRDQMILIMYPAALFYASFALLALF